jgi:hypothetical protein
MPFDIDRLPTDIGSASFGIHLLSACSTSMSTDTDPVRACNGSMSVDSGSLSARNDLLSTEIYSISTCKD